MGCQAFSTKTSASKSEQGIEAGLALQSCPMLHLLALYLHNGSLDILCHQKQVFLDEPALCSQDNFQEG